MIREGILASLLAASLGLSAQVINVGNVFQTGSVNNTAHGVNSAYSFHHVLDDNFVLQPDVRDEMIATDYDVLRFPGGAIGNYYRLNGTGYGAVKAEVQSVANTVQCNGSGFYCFDRDQQAPRNFVYDFLEYLEAKYTATEKPTEILYVLNLLLHFVYNYDQIPQLASINTLQELDDALAGGLISADFHERILENYGAMEMLIESPYADIKGIEMGNEFYFYQEVTTFPYPPTNSNPFFNLNSALNTIQPRMERYLTLINFYRRLVEPLLPGIKVGVPIGGINHFGNMANADLLWNTAVKNWVIGEVDALIPHMYIKTSGPEVNPPDVGHLDDNAQTVEIKDRFLFDLETKFINTTAEIVEFFGLDASYRELWLTEFNVNKNESNTQIWDEWTNTFLHAAFLGEWEKRMSASPISEYYRYVILHGWTSGNTGYEHCVLSRKNDGTVIRRAPYYPNKYYSFLKSLDTRSLTGSLSKTGNAHDLYADVFYTRDSQPSDCPTEKLLLQFTNLRSTPADVNFNFSGGTLSIDGRGYTVTESVLKGYTGQDLASQFGTTGFNGSEDVYTVSEFSVDADISGTVELPGYSAGVVELTLEPDVQPCLPLSADAPVWKDLALEAWPNPATDKLLITLPQALAGARPSIEIADVSGRVLLRSISAESRIYLDVSALQSGVYFVRAASGENASQALPFVKH